MISDRKIWQPLHASLRTTLDPQYVSFHDAYVQYVQPDNTKVWDGTARTHPSLPYCGSPLVKVGRTVDVRVEDRFNIRVFVPQDDGGGGEAATQVEKGGGGGDDGPWPLFVWFHGGGWAVGNIDSDNDFCTRVCQQARCIVANVDYRLAPEHPYPAAIEDGVSSVRWLLSPQGGLSRFPIDASRVAIGGTSAGGLLSAVTALRCATSPSSPAVTFAHQVLIVPVIDNTATADSPAWQVNGATAPWLTPARMLWYRDMWLPRGAQDRAVWLASVNQAPPELLAAMPPTWMAVAEADLLAPEGLAFAEQLREAGVEVRTVVLQGCTHQTLPLNGTLRVSLLPASAEACGLTKIPGIMDKGRQLIDDAAAVVKKAFWAS